MNLVNAVMNLAGMLNLKKETRRYVQYILKKLFYSDDRY